MVMTMSAGRPSSAALVDARVELRQGIGIVATLLGMQPLARIARHRPGGVVELQIAAAGIVEGADRRAIRFADIIKETVEVRIKLFADRAAALAEVQGARRRYGHFRRHAGMRLEKLEMLNHRMAGKADLAVDLERVRFRRHAVKLNAAVSGVHFHAIETAEEIELPPGAAQFAVGRKLQARFLLLADRPLDFPVLDRGQSFRRDLVAVALGARLF